jgi:aminoglycoside 6-adenylyltransferase
VGRRAPSWPGGEAAGPPSAVDAIEQRFVIWANAREDIRAAVVVGSRARVDHPADEWADLDIMIFARDTRPYLSSSDWISHIGSVQLAALGRTVGGDPEWLVVLDNGLDVDLVLIPTVRARWGVRALALVKRYPQLLRLLPGGLAARAREVIPTGSDTFRRGVRVLLDRDGLVSPMQRVFNERPPAATVAQREFRQAVDRFWLMVERTAKKLRRGELWVAKRGCDGLLKESLLQMMEWQARAKAGAAADTWHAGRFLEEWADPGALDGLGRAYAHYDEADIWCALMATMDLFRSLSRETAQLLGHEYPVEGDEYVSELVRELEAGRRKPAD